MDSTNSLLSPLVYSTFAVENGSKIIRRDDFMESMYNLLNNK